jgi:diaminohydroxyphosphoribosylaminopyrimidine deaminase/5-amino-6-(5-phosphoribosylamino)uracil reductase
VWVTGDDYSHPQYESGRIERWVTPLVDDRIDLRAVLLSLAERGVNEVLVEAGATLGGSLINQGLVDQGVLYLAPKLLGRSARSLYDIAPAQLAVAPEVLIQEIRAVGDDLRMDWTLRTRA